MKPTVTRMSLQRPLLCAKGLFQGLQAGPCHCCNIVEMTGWQTWRRDLRFGLQAVRNGGGVGGRWVWLKRGGNIVCPHGALEEWRPTSPRTAGGPALSPKDGQVGSALRMQGTQAWRKGKPGSPPVSPPCPPASLPSASLSSPRLSKLALGKEIAANCSECLQGFLLFP